MAAAGLYTGEPGKGRACWLAIGHVLAEERAAYIAFQDADVVNYTPRDAGAARAARGRADRGLRLREGLLRPRVRPAPRAGDTPAADPAPGRLHPADRGRTPTSATSPRSATLSPASSRSSRDLAERMRLPCDWGLEIVTLFEALRHRAPRAHLPGGDRGALRPQAPGACPGTTPSRGLNRMARDVVKHLLRTLAAAGVNLSPGLLMSLLAAYQREAEDAVTDSYAVSVVNGLAVRPPRRGAERPGLHRGPARLDRRVPGRPPGPAARPQLGPGVGGRPRRERAAARRGGGRGAAVGHGGSGVDDGSGWSSPISTGPCSTRRPTTSLRPGPALDALRRAGIAPGALQQQDPGGDGAARDRELGLDASAHRRERRGGRVAAGAVLPWPPWRRGGRGPRRPGARGAPGSASSRRCPTVAGEAGVARALLRRDDRGRGVGPHRAVAGAGRARAAARVGRAVRGRGGATPRSTRAWTGRPRRGLRVTRGGRVPPPDRTRRQGSGGPGAGARAGPRGVHGDVVGLGDAANDLALLLAVDRPIVMPRPDGAVDPALAAALPGAERAPGPGPAGWAAAVLAVLAGEPLPRVAP